MDEPGPSLVRLRLHWYAHATARLLLRRWQAIVLTLAVIAPAGVPPKALLSMLAAPVSYLLVPDVAFFFRLSVFLLLVGSSMLWVLIQRDAILGGRFSNFVESLPLPAKSILLADLLLLVVADSPLWSFLLVCSAFPYAPNSLATWTSVDYLIRSAWLILFSGTVIAAQLAILRTRSEKLLFCALAAILLCSVVSVPGAVLRSILVAGTALMVVLALQVSGWPGTTKRPKWRIQPHDRRTQSRNGYAPAPIMLHSLRLLVRQHGIELSMRLMLAAVVVTAACLLMQIWNFDARALGLTVIVLAAIALILSGLYRSLHMEHMNADAVFGALPLPARWWVWPDTITVVAIGLPFVFLLCGVLLAQAYAWSVTWKLLVADVVLLVGLRFPQAYARRHAVVGAAGMAALWCAPTMAAVL